MEWLYQPESWVALLTLTILEIVLGIDNIIFISILSQKLPAGQRDKARRLGLGLAVVSRLVLLFSIFILTELTATLFTVFGHALSIRDLILIGGGLFLLAKSTHEIHTNIEAPGETKPEKAPGTFLSVVAQITVLDIVFSIDSVITAIGMAQQVQIMAVAIVLAVGLMLLMAKSISDFVERHPTFKVLALSFLLLVGVALIGEGFELHIPKGYIYFAMGFSFFVELLNMKMRRRAPV